MSRRPVPLMYIQSPSAIFELPIEHEESTSIFVKEAPEEGVTESIQEIKEVLPSVQKQLKKIQSPFGSHLYQPVTIKLSNNEEKFGTIEQISEERLSLIIEESESQKITIQTADIVDVLWRGKSIPKK